MAIWFALIVTAYLLGSVPVAYLVAKLARGIDIRQYGTGQIGGGNLWRMTSWKLGLPVGFFDLSKGVVMVWAAQSLGLSVVQQLAVGAAAVVGHNWSLFLRFGGGRGIATTMGIVLVLPFLGEVTPWPTIACLSCVVFGSVLLRSSPLPVLAGVTSLPVVGAIYEPAATALGLLFFWVIVVIKRLVAPRAAEATTISKKKVLLNRLLFDRDIMDRKGWMYRLPFKAKDMEELSDGLD